MASYTSIDVLDMTGKRLFPIYKVLQLIAFTQEPGIVTIYVEEVKQ